MKAEFQTQYMGKVLRHHARRGVVDMCVLNDSKKRQTVRLEEGQHVHDGDIFFYRVTGNDGPLDIVDVIESHPGGFLLTSKDYLSLGIDRIIERIDAMIGTLWLYPEETHVPAFGREMHYRTAFQKDLETHMNALAYIRTAPEVRPHLQELLSYTNMLLEFADGKLFPGYEKFMLSVCNLRKHARQFLYEEVLNGKYYKSLPVLRL